VFIFRLKIWSKPSQLGPRDKATFTKWETVKNFCLKNRVIDCPVHQSLGIYIYGESVSDTGHTEFESKFVY
jgi:hypothetical protein